MDVDNDGRLDLVLLLAQTEATTENIEQKNFGSAISGASFRYIVTTLEDEKYVRVAAQSP